MSKPRSPNSMLTKIENMQVGDEIFTDKSAIPGIVRNNVHIVRWIRNF